MTLGESEKRILGNIARESLASALAGRAYQPQPLYNPPLLERRGCFVTLETDGRLRGCIGCFTSTHPLYLTVAEYTRHSALDDPRFVMNRLREADLPDVAIDISALSPLEECRDPENITLGVHGIYVVKNGRHGCFLPQVATETGWTVEEYWGHCCRDKAGLDWNAWREPGIELMTFTAEVFKC